MTPQELPALSVAAEERTRGVGILSGRTAAGRVTLPLARVEISARVADRIAQVTVRETFRNTTTEPLEAVYIFPLAGGAAVSEFELKVGSRTLRGKIEERDAARRRYKRALDDGRRAALLEQERDDVFTVQVGNLPPGEEVAVRLVYSERLPYFEDGSTELRLPLVVAPRYIPGRPLEREPVGDGVEVDSDLVPDASRITPPRLAPGFDPKVALGVDVEFAGTELADLRCSQHAVRTSVGFGAVRISLVRQDELLNRDFVLRWCLAGPAVRTTCLASGPFAMISIVPPKRDGFLGVPRDVLFLVDRSGSMAGVKMASAARACSILLDTLGPNDRFAVAAFDNSVEWLSPEAPFLVADEGGLAKGHQFLRTIGARGGTELDLAMGDGLARIRARKESAGRIPVVVLLTDGEVGDEHVILKRIQKELGDARVFTVGIDTAVNEGFLKRLADLAGGTSTFVVPGESLDEALRAIGREIGNPLVSDLQIEDAGAGLKNDSLSPARIPDLFAGRSSAAFFQRKGSGRIRVRGRFSDGKAFEETVAIREVEAPALAHLWARARVAELEDRFRLSSDDAVREQIVKLSIDHSLLTRFTAFVVVDESEIVSKDGTRRKIVQPVHMPDRWELNAEAAAGGAAMGLASITGSMSPARCAPAPMARRRNMKSPKECDIQASADVDVVSPKDREEIAKALEKLVRAFAEARSKGGADALEKARAELVSLLSKSPIAPQLPLLQRFLRSTAVELVAALRAPGADLRPLFETAAKALDKARGEAAKAMKVKGGFWEATI